MKLLIIGNGGREHAIAWKAAQNKSVDRIYCAPGNGGTENENKCINIKLTSIDELRDFAVSEGIDLTIVGPEATLVEGIVDSFREKGLRIFGPSRAAAELEGSKAFAKDFMKKYGVKTADYQVFYDMKEALDYLSKGSYPLVIKADGLAAGKGVVICNSYEEGKATVVDFMEKDIFKGSGKKVVIEEYLEGVEASVLSITDGKTIIPFLSAKDHKTIYENNQGPNTGGMGAISPNPYCTDAVLGEFRDNILKPTLEGIQKENLDYKGIIFFGLMITKKGTYLLEYNVRMGDPETQAVLPLMKTDFVELINHSLDERLSEFKVEWEEGHCCSVVASSGGYPGDYKTGLEISGIENVSNKVFIAGAKKDGVLKTSGGRVLSVSAVGRSPEEAREKAYSDMEKISFEGIYYRKDIGKI